MPRLTPPVALRLDGDAEIVRKNHEQRILELQTSLFAGCVVVPDVKLPDGAEVHVAHGLGRAPRFVRESTHRGGLGGVGVVRDLGARLSAGPPIDRRQVVVLRADGFGGTIIVDVLVL